MYNIYIYIYIYILFQPGFRFNSTTTIIIIDAHATQLKRTSIMVHPPLPGHGEISGASIDSP
ncbi:hypothetical protein I7I50_03466 [Histoplasma capsulatum G186AR]|uniref:Uncharacterized protein n=1 Tax=Ajellomyces capsulatus TaxID=5037 RepID=A0A8H7YNH1_AJECA|nr:hypothetical protein I7I52_04373 [Histoplasma capsulatum]QSS74608.1 hypothetical protein I7I50_03466 [Histoplasma capsulatum G186AR]